jgi:hypothetical protein
MDRWDVWPPPIRRIVPELAVWIERHRGPAKADHVYNGFDDEEIACDGGNPFERKQWVPQVVEHAKKKDDVKRSNALRREIHHVDVRVLDA